MCNGTYLFLLIALHTSMGIVYASDMTDNHTPESNDSQRILPMRSSAVFRFYLERSTLMEDDTFM